MFQIIDKKNYEIKNKIGNGANSIVYRGILNNKNIAIKKFKNDYQEFNDFLKNELTILQRLQNNIYFITIFGISYISNDVYLLMEYFKDDLYNYIYKDDFWKRSIKYNDNIIPKLTSKFYYKKDNFYFSYQIERNEKILITKQLLNSLYHLHNLNIIHGDIKSENFVYMSNTLKMIDFNTSTIVNDKKEINIECKYGTEGYISPEQYDLKLSYKSDIYSLCITILEVWCGMIWLEDTNDFKINRNLILKSLRKLEKEEEKLSKIIRKNISLQPEKRNSLKKIIQQFNQL